MSSPASDYADRRHEENVARIKRERSKRLELLGDMARTVGFGEHESHWFDREVFKHLEAAYQLLMMTREKK